jgi:putative ABC transport system substrate-binding protein
MPFSLQMVWIAARCMVTAGAMSAILGAWITPPDLVAAERIAVLVSSSEPPFEETLAGFQKYLAKQGIDAEYKVYRLAGETSLAEQAIENIKKSGVRVIFTLGSVGTEAAVKIGSDIPVVACLVLRSDTIRSAPDATGVVLEFPFEVQFRWIQTMLPDAKTVGVIYNPDENGKRVEAAAQVARERGLRLEAREVHTLRDIPDALDSLSRSADVLWGLADNVVLSPRIAKHILLFSFRNSIPFIGPSAAWVKAGALYSLNWDYTDMGSQCGEIAFKVLRGMTAGDIPPATPRKILYSLNLKTAQQLKITIAEEIARKAANVY